MKARLPSASRAVRARDTRSGSDGSGRSPGHSTPRSLRRSWPRPRSRSAVEEGAGSANPPGTGTEGPAGAGAPMPFLVVMGGLVVIHGLSHGMMAGVRVLIAPDSFNGTLTAAEAAEAIAEGWRRHAPLDDLDLCPLSDGGPGFLDALRVA